MTGSKTVRLAWLSLFAALIAVLVLVISSGGGYSHQLQVVVPEATGVIPGERVVAAGETVGSITSATVTRDYKAHIVIGIDDSVWPLPTDTTLTLRMGGTIKYTDRFIEIARGHDRTVFADNAPVPSSQFVTPVEYDQLFDIFNAPTRAGLKSFMNNGGQALSAAEGPFRSALGDAAPAVEQADAVFRDLDAQQQSLSTLVSSTDEVARAVATSNPGLGQLLDGASNTFTALSSQSSALQRAISAAPGTLYYAGRSLAHASRSLANVADLSNRLSPGVSQLRDLATPLDQALASVVNVEPDAVSTLNTVRTASPSLDSLLGVARATLMPRVQSISKQLAKQVDCIRPYTPDILGLLTAWTGFWGDGDSNDKVLRGALGADAMPGDVPTDSEQLGKILPSLKIDYPQLPGMGVDEPWYQPQCGLTAKDLNLADDSEAGTFDPLGAKLVPYPMKSQ